MFFVGFQNIAWPTDSGITEAQAKQKCITTIIGSQVTAACAQSLGANYTSEVTSCVEDIGVSTALCTRTSCQGNLIKELELHIYIDLYFICITGKEYVKDPGWYGALYVREFFYKIISA